MLLISGGHTPGTSGGGTFVSNGGRLLLDTVLNEGGSNSRSDVLVIDGASLGAGGATRLFAKNAGGAGALTVDNGILVVQALIPTVQRAVSSRLALRPWLALSSTRFSTVVSAPMQRTETGTCALFELRAVPNSAGVPERRTWSGADASDPELPR